MFTALSFTKFPPRSAARVAIIFLGHQALSAAIRDGFLNGVFVLFTSATKPSAARSGGT